MSEPADMGEAQVLTEGLAHFWHPVEYSAAELSPPVGPRAARRASRDDRRAGPAHRRGPTACGTPAGSERGAPPEGSGWPGGGVSPSAAPTRDLMAVKPMENMPGLKGGPFPEAAVASRHLYEVARTVIPGGTSKANLRLMPHPIYFASGSGCRVRHVDGIERVDATNHFTALVHGHAFPPVVEAVTRRLREGSAFVGPTLEESPWRTCWCGGCLASSKIASGTRGQRRQKAGADDRT
jgi:hypothetical protein